MSSAPQKMRDFAERLIAYETSGNKSSKTEIPTACLIIDKLRPQLATLMGNIGFRALLSRTLALANPEFPWLRAVADATRRRLYQQTLANVGLLGLAGLSDSFNPTIIPHSSVALPRPQFVLRDPGQNDVRRALEVAELGVLLVDGCRMPTMANFGVNYDTLTANLLNTAASGLQPLAVRSNWPIPGSLAVSACAW